MKTHANTILTRLAAFWILGSLYACVLATDRKNWSIAIIPLFGIPYGLIWIVVMLLGRQLRPGETRRLLKALLTADFAVISKALKTK